MVVLPGVEQDMAQLRQRLNQTLLIPHPALEVEGLLHNAQCRRRILATRRDERAEVQRRGQGDRPLELSAQRGALRGQIAGAVHLAELAG